MSEAQNTSLVQGGQFNIGHICTRQQCDAGLGEKTAVRWISSQLERRDYSYQDLETRSNQIANLLLGLGIKRGDRVFIYLPRSPEIFFLFLGILKIQAIVGVLFSNFGEEALTARLGDSGAKILFTKKSALRKIKAVWPALPELGKIIVVDLPEDQSDSILSLEQLRAGAAGAYQTPLTSADTPSVLQYTSGSTGTPKGVQHLHRSIQTQSATCRDILSVKPGDIYWCTADPGWVTGISYGMIGPLSLGITQIQFGGNFQLETWLSILQSEKVNIWYTSPTALRMLMQTEDSFFNKFDLASMRHIFSVGEPLNPVVIEWADRVLQKTVYDTWWQTETGAIMIANRPGLPVKPGSMGKPCSHTHAAILDGDGTPLPDLRQGRLCLRIGWPSLFEGYHRQSEAYAKRIKNGYYDSGDIAFRDTDGYFWFVGRGDDVINTAGHLVGPFEVESALLEIKEVAEAGVIGTPDEMLYEKVVAYLHLRPGTQWSKNLELQLRLHVSNRVSTIATPQEFRIVESIPKNRSGKVMRRVLKAWFHGTDPGDVSTMEER